MQPQGGEFSEGEFPEGEFPGGEGPQGELPQGEFPQGKPPVDEANRETGRPDQEGPMGGKPEEGRGPQNHADVPAGELNTAFTIQSGVALFSGTRFWAKTKPEAALTAFSVVLRSGEAAFVLR